MHYKWWTLCAKQKYKSWVLDYLSAWEKRAMDNDGVLPDNIGPNGRGETDEFCI